MKHYSLITPLTTYTKIDITIRLDRNNATKMEINILLKQSFKKKKSLPNFHPLHVAKHCNSTYPRIVSYIFPDHFPGWSRNAHTFLPCIGCTLREYAIR